MPWINGKYYTDVEQIHGMPEKRRQEQLQKEREEQARKDALRLANQKREDQLRRDKEQREAMEKGRLTQKRIAEQEHARMMQQQTNELKMAQEAYRLQREGMAMNERQAQASMAQAEKQRQEAMARLDSLNAKNASESQIQQAQQAVAEANKEYITQTAQGKVTTKGGVTTVEESPETKQIRMLLEARQQKILGGEGDKTYEEALKSKYDVGLQDITKKYQQAGTSGSTMEAYEKAKFLANRDTEIALNAQKMKESELGSISSLLSQGWQQNYGLANLASAQSQFGTNTELERAKMAQQAGQFAQSQAQQHAQFQASLGSDASRDLLQLASQFYRNY